MSTFDYQICLKTVVRITFLRFQKGDNKIHLLFQSRFDSSILKN